MSLTLNASSDLFDDRDIPISSWSVGVRSEGFVMTESLGNAFARPEWGVLVMMARRLIIVLG